ncbi:hypothetical protein X769_15645 [Mesorhizobium sp. LSJC268A00]|uniref:hypothetical protein n=1 Tax=unclassified Mesorhizobium TaxID=325217 RepID=UPI0003CF6025|nr:MULTISPECIES: hypothetical protein [unclassified Mesorhizobium]ESX03908.1 hypothetical protein X769_15645 [Mesorhizobium sp. LSJC268A00]ESZ10770.1 hypothetical protein X735_27565 [Mesorhizobium sp. L2C085B000]
MTSWPTTYMLAAKVARRRPMPSGSFTIDGTNDYFSVRLIDPGTKQRFISLGAVPQGLKGLWFNGHNEPGLECVVLKRNLPHFGFQGDHYYRGSTIRTNSPLEYIWNWLSNYALRHEWWDRWTQGRFNKRGLTRQDRMQVLRLFVNETAKSDAFNVSIFGLMELLYSRRWFRHPEGDATNNYYELVLKSLAHSGDLTASDHGMSYALNPQGITTVASYELEERRHNDSIVQQSRIGKLTWVLIGVGLLQAAATFFAPH